MYKGSRGWALAFAGHPGLDNDVLKTGRQEMGHWEGQLSEAPGYPRAKS